MRMLTLALLLASTISIPAYAQDRDNDGMDAGEPVRRQTMQDRGFERRESEGPSGQEVRGARAEAMAQARAMQTRRQMDGEPDSGRRGGWGGGQVQTQSPAAPVPQAEPSRGWGGNRDWQRRGDVTTSTVPAAPQARERGWQGRMDDANRNDGRSWNDRRDRDRGQFPPPNEGRHWDGNRHDGARRDGRRWDGHIADDRHDDRRWDGHRDGRYEGRWYNGQNHRDWNRAWRHDRRYDWQRYRNDYRLHYRQPRYYNPYGYRYGYRRFGIGIYLDSLFFSNRYWLNDPWEYRLPPAPYGCRWVRYYDDVLLVDTRSGYVVDAIYGFFW